MPLGLTRYQESRQTHFVTFTCYHRRRHLQDEPVRDIVVAAIEQARKHYAFYVYAFVIMPDHVHLLMSEPQRGLVANAIQSLKISSAKRSGGPHLAATTNRNEANSRAAKCGTAPEPFWQKRYYDRNIRNHKEFVKKRRYTHRNPVTAELVKSPQDWKWSSFCHYLTGEWCGVEIESEWTAREREKRGIVPQLSED